MAVDVVNTLSAEEVHAHKVRELGLDPAALDLASSEAVAAALRRAAGLLSPCAPSTLMRAVLNPLRGLMFDPEVLRESVEVALEALVAYGDLLESAEVTAEHSAHQRVVLYTAPPAFVRRASAVAFLLGIAPDYVSPLPDELTRRIEYLGHTRRLSPESGEDLRAELIQAGLIELSYEAWLRAPEHETPAQHAARLDALVQQAQPSGEVPGLILLDSSRPVSYYRGRWVEPRSQSGRFVARRSQAYGADLWCYIAMRDGLPERFIDLPLPGSRWRGCDEAWRLQLAIDAQLGSPQRFRIRQGLAGTRIFDCFSPVPLWARRRWDIVGEPVPSSGCLFSYKFTDRELAEELSFVRDRLWLVNDDSQSGARGVR